jgi:hypothetical protein
VAGTGGLEPATPGFGIRCSTIGAMRLLMFINRTKSYLNQKEVKLITVSSLCELYVLYRTYNIFLLKIFQYEFFYS